MSSYQAVMKAHERQCASVSAKTKVPHSLVGKVIQYAKSLTQPDKPGEIDETIFIAQHLYRFGLTNALMIQVIFERLSKKTPYGRIIALEDYVYIICLYMSPIVALQVDHVFNVYDFDSDGKLGKPELNLLVSNPLPLSNNIEDADMDIKDFHEQILSTADTNSDHMVCKEEFFKLVNDNILYIELLGPCLPNLDYLRVFRRQLESMSPAETRTYFAGERLRSLNYPPEYCYPRDRYYSMDLDIP